MVFSAQVNELAARAELTQTFAVELRVTPSGLSVLAGFVGKAEIIPEKPQGFALADDGFGARFAPSGHS